MCATLTNDVISYSCHVAVHCVKFPCYYSLKITAVPYGWGELDNIYQERVTLYYINLADAC